MQILHVIDSLAVGGAEKLVVTLLRNLKGYNLHLIVLNKPDNLLKEIPPDCKVTFLNYKSPMDIPKCSYLVRAYIKRHHINIVHSHLYWSNTIARLATPGSVQIFNSIHNISSKTNYSVNRLSLYLEKLTYKKRHYIITVSKAVLDDFDKWIGLKGPATVLYNFINDDFFGAFPKLYFSAENIRLIAVGTFKKQKNYSYLIEAFKSMPAHVSLDIFGNGPLKETVYEQINAHKLNIRLCGLRQDMSKVLPVYDAYVMCSTYEGHSLALMEAMACGLPAFLSDIPVQREAAGNAAIYFDLNSPNDFVNKLVETFNDIERLKYMSKEGIKRANQLACKDGYIQQLETLYEAAGKHHTELLISN